MQVWFPTTVENATPLSSIKVTASRCWELDSVNAANDGTLPTSSSDHGVKRMTWWPNKGTAEWLQYEFLLPQTLKGCAVYWFDDTGKGACRLPASWKIQSQDPAGNWADLPVAGTYPVAKDKLCEATFTKPVTTRRLRLSVQLQANVSGGVLEWKLLP